ncbi:unnamed protein product [Trifolium pratense]|uniref:Uncharacterized protein n=1 Tax=Trifolium pratense TaxID=57577 RepID=A0ACB0IR96_TRIPR|nr:unnamed protein product [Trifolium pratense]
MTEPDDSDDRDDEYIVTMASDSETTDEVNLLPPPEIPIGIDIGTWPCCVAVWNGSDFDLYSNETDENIMKSGETFKFVSSSILISTSEVSLSQDQVHDMSYEATIYNMRRLIGRIDTDPVVHASKNFPLGTSPCGISLQLKVLAETQLKRPVRNVVFTVPVSFNRFQLNWIYYACAMASLGVLKLMPQPTAVAGNNCRLLLLLMDPLTASVYRVVDIKNFVTGARHSFNCCCSRVRWLDFVFGTTFQNSICQRLLRD